MLFWNKLLPISFKNGVSLKKDTISMWFKIEVTSIPTGIVGVLWEDEFDALFYNYQTVAIMPILFGTWFTMELR